MLLNLYKWHQRLGLIALIPILAWSLSGLTHPMMAHWFKIKAAKRFIKAKNIPKINDFHDLTTILNKHQIDSFQNIRFLSFKDQWYCQLKQEGDVPIYLNLQDQSQLQNGDQLYARHLAREFSGDQTSKIKSIELITNFDAYYKRINRLLPVYKITFDRQDKLEVYVETISSRLGTLNDNNRKRLMWVFSNLHNWDFLKFSPLLKSFSLIFFSTIMFLSAILGLWLYASQWKKLNAIKQKTGIRPKSTVLSRRIHKSLGITLSFAMLAFTFSGGYHAFSKVNKSDHQPIDFQDRFSIKDLSNCPIKFIKNLKDNVYDVKLKKIENDSYFQIYYLDEKPKKAYYNIQSLKALADAEEQLVIALSQKFKSCTSKIKSIEIVSKFGGEYGFINKRLPVLKITYDQANGRTDYIETSSNTIAASFNNSSRLEALSFLFLHKYHSLDFLGKNNRDLFIAFTVFGNHR